MLRVAGRHRRVRRDIKIVRHAVAATAARGRHALIVAGKAAIGTGSVVKIRAPRPVLRPRRDQGCDEDCDNENSKPNGETHLSKPLLSIGDREDHSIEQFSWSNAIVGVGKKFSVQQPRTDIAPFLAVYFHVPYPLEPPTGHADVP
jgi:hypothetical protein